MLTKSNCKSYAILAAIYDLTNEDDIRGMFTEPYCNGREQGFSVVSWNWSVQRRAIFSERRNSDDIVVYFGDSYKFSPQGNCPSEEIYRNSYMTFDSYDYLKAAEFILHYLKTGEPYVTENDVY